MACYEKDCHYVMTHDGDCFYEGLPMDKKENCPMYKAKTNADHIRMMSDEELADFITAGHYTPHCPVPQCEADETTDCEQCWLAWLRKEANEKQM